MKTKITNEISIRVFLFLALIQFGATNIEAAPGSLDFSFGNGGIVVTPITNTHYDFPTSMQVQPDGKIVVCGDIIAQDEEGENYLSSFFIARYNQNGTLDASFGTNGKIIVPVVHFNGDYAGRDIALQPDGKIVAVGFRYNFPAGVFAVVDRYNPDGTLDASFGAGGRVVTQVGVHALFTSSVAVQPDGKILAAGAVSLTQSGYLDNAFAAVRFNSNGTLDASFGAGGIAITAFAGNSEVLVNAVLLQPNGRIVVVGGNRVRGTIYGFALVRYNADGSLDSGFGSNGKVFHIIDGRESIALDGVLQPDGKIVAVGYAGGFARIVRYNADGSIDTGFAANGIFRIENVPGINTRDSLALQPDGKILAFGVGYNSGVHGFAVLRLNPDGSPDAGFGTNGRIITLIGENNDSHAIAGEVQPDGKILAYGTTTPPGNSENIAIVRYLGDSASARPARFDFDGDRRADVSVFRPSDSVWYLNQSTNGLSAAQFGLSTDQIIPADFDGDGKTDIAVFRDGIWFWLNSSNGNFNAVRFGLAGDIPQPADFDGDGRAELAVYRGGTWLTFNLANNQFNAVQFGLSTDKPALADYDGDSRADYAVYRDGSWYLNRSTQGFAAIQFGLPTDRLVPADYDGDGKTDLAVYRDGTWYLQQSANGFAAFQFGLSTDIPAPADYDGDGRAEIAVFRSGIWFLRQSSNAQLSVQQFGLGSDVPVPGIQ